MNSAQRRTTYRRLRKLMRDKTPVVMRLSRHPRDRVLGRVVRVFKQPGIALVHDLQQHYHAQQFAARYIKPVPRCHRVTL